MIHGLCGLTLLVMGYWHVVMKAKDSFLCFMCSFFSLNVSGLLFL